jgi:serine/threonine-protein kinase
MKEDLQSTLVGGYTIERELGGGGQSRVFLAKELALQRDVVIKVLPAETGGTVSAERFNREIRLAAQLQHAHIVPLLSAGVSAGLPFYTMPLVQGETLRGRLAREGALPVADAMKILRDVATALAYAHERGVVHRDIKPENILLTTHDALVTDFGVAKAIQASRTETDASEEGSLTSAGIAVGTPVYMAPEQAVGDPGTDQRADLYALGVVAYELLTGHTPFPGRSMQQVLAANATETPPSIVASRPAVPALLASLVMQCLEKRPADRPQSASSIIQGIDSITQTRAHGFGTAPTPTRRWPVRLAAVAAGGPGRAVTLLTASVIAVVAIAALAVVTQSRGALRGARGEPLARSIAVLPFENSSGDTAMAFFADGMSDELATALSRVPGLHVAARGSSQAFERSRLAPRAIATKLNVETLLYGAVRRAGNRLRVWTQLVNASTEQPIWTATYDTTLTDVFDLQDRLARAIVDTLRINLAGASSSTAALAPRGTSDLTAYDYYLKGHFHAVRQGLATQRAIEFFTRAVERDPSFARAHAALASVYTFLPVLGIARAESAHALARRSADRALAIDPNSAEAHAAKGMLFHHQWDFAGAGRELRLALALDSGNAIVRQQYAIDLGMSGRIEEGIAESRRVLEYDPLAVDALVGLTYFLICARRYREAIDVAQRIFDIDSTSLFGYSNLGLAYGFAGMADSAVVALETAYRLDPQLIGNGAYLALGYALAGRRSDVARQVAIEKRRPAGNSPNFITAILEIAQGNLADALMASERGVQRREPLFRSVSLGCDPIFDVLKSSSRFTALLKGLDQRVCPAAPSYPIKTTSLAQPG